MKMLTSYERDCRLDLKVGRFKLRLWRWVDLRPFGGVNPSRVGIRYSHFAPVPTDDGMRLLTVGLYWRDLVFSFSTPYAGR